MEDYIEKIDDVVSEEVENGNFDESYYDPEYDKSMEKYEIDIDSLTHVELELVDQEEQSPVDMIASNIKSTVLPSVYAASNGEVMWKKYGNRYFTAKYTRWIGPGYCTLKTENHYNVSSSGITERSADSWVDISVGSFTSVSKPTNKITKKTATSVNSYAHCKTTLSVKFECKGQVVQYDLRERTGIKYLQKDSKNKKIKVKHYWKSLD